MAHRWPRGTAFVDGAGSTDGGLFGRATVFHAADENTTRSAAGRAALESVLSPTSLLPHRGVTWRALKDDLIVSSCDVPPERPDMCLRIDHRARCVE